MSINLSDAARRRLSGMADSRGLTGIFSRGSNVYNGGLSAANNQFADARVSTQPFNSDSVKHTMHGTPKTFQGGGQMHDTGFGSPKMFGENQNSQPQWGFDAGYEEGMSNIRENMSRLESERQLALQRQREDFERAERGLGEWRDDSLTANTEGMADRGLVHSGINIKQQADIGEMFLKNLEQLGQIDARTRSDLSRQFAEQRQQLEGMQRQLELERAEKEAARQREQAMWDAINATPEPTAAGRYDLGGDKQNKLGVQVEDLFKKHNVPIASANETDAQRIQRIVNEVHSGQRNMADVEKSIRRLARIQGETGGSNPYGHINLGGALTGKGDITGADRKYLDDPNKLAERIQAIFRNQGVDIGGHANETAHQRLLRMMSEVGSGKRSLNDIRNSVQGIAQRQG